MPKNNLSPKAEKQVDQLADAIVKTAIAGQLAILKKAKRIPKKKRAAYIESMARQMQANLGMGAGVMALNIWLEETELMKKASIR